MAFCQYIAISVYQYCTNRNFINGFSGPGLRQGAHHE
jgi:hypothetical protein